MPKKKQKKIQIQIPTQQPDCIDANGHLNIWPIIDIAKELNCPFIGLIGEKRVGKTYGCISYALKEYFASGRGFFYARRYDKTFTQNICGNLVNVHRQDIINLSGGKLNSSELRGKIFSISRNGRDAKGNITRDNVHTLAYCRSLNNVETETADDKEEVSCVIYDEFLTRGRELSDEYNKLMILHANATGKRVDKFVPMFLLGNTVSRESKVAEEFGIRLRELKRGLNIIQNTDGVPRMVMYYLPETSKSTAAGALYYDRFHNEHINMISHGSWTLGTYNIATPQQLALSGYNLLFTHNNLAVKVIVTTFGIMPLVVVSHPDEEYALRVTSGLSGGAINYVPDSIVKIVLQGNMVAESSELGEDFRDICKHLQNGDRIVKYYE